MSTQVPTKLNTAVSYAYQVTVAGNVVGTLQGFTPSSTRNLDRVREIRNDLNDVFEIVPGRSDYSITIERLELFTENIMKALGYSNFDTLSDLTSPITITETLTSGMGRVRAITYVDCWVQNWSKTIREGTITVSESVTVFPTKMIVTQDE